MSLYAIFLCTQLGCQMIPEAMGVHLLPNGQPTIFFASRQECEHTLRQQIPIPDINSGLYRCLGRHVDPWR